MNNFNSQQKAWEKEYQEPAFISLHDKPQSEVMKFAQWLKKDGAAYLGKNILQDPDRVEPLRLLDLGCGNGRNLVYFTENYHAEGWGIDFSPTAIAHARSNKNDLRITYTVASIGDDAAYASFQDNSFDIIMDITASNALYEGERDIYLREAFRTLKPGGIMMVRSLCLDADKNAKNLLQMSPGPESGMYILPDQLIAEKVFGEEEFRDRYGEFFNIIELTKPSGYQRWAEQSFKRRYIVAYMQKK